MRITNIRFIILINLPIRFSCQYTIHTTIIILKNKITIIIKTFHHISPKGTNRQARFSNSRTVIKRTTHHHLCLNGLYSLTQTLYFIS